MTGTYKSQACGSYTLALYEDGYLQLARCTGAPSLFVGKRVAACLRRCRLLFEPFVTMLRSYWSYQQLPTWYVRLLQGIERTLESSPSMAWFLLYVQDFLRSKYRGACVASLSWTHAADIVTYHFRNWIRVIFFFFFFLFFSFLDVYRNSIIVEYLDLLTLLLLLVHCIACIVYAWYLVVWMVVDSLAIVL